jgi:hypothetical protein
LNLGPEPADLFNVPTSVATLRASDEDRDATIRVLNDAASVGRLTTEEHADRVETALRAQTLGDLAALTADLAPPTTRRTFPIRRLVLGAIVIIVAAVSGDLIVAQHGTSAAIQTTTSAPSPSGSSSDGFVQSQPSVAGKFCNALLASQKRDPSGPSAIGTSPTSDPWGTQTLIVPSHPSTRYVQDFAAVQSLANATSVVQMAWQKNGYQYAQLTTQCLSAYDSHFRWNAPVDPSTGVGVISVSYADRHSLVAAKSASGTCWYELNVMGPGDPVIVQDNLPSYGVFIAKSSTTCAASAALSSADWESPDPLPPQLTQ